MEMFYRLPFVSIVKDKRDNDFLNNKNILKLRHDVDQTDAEYYLFTKIFVLDNYNYTTSFLQIVKRNYTQLEQLCIGNKLHLLVSDTSRKGYTFSHDIIGLRFLCEKQKLLFQLKYTEHLVKIFV
jgi:hypothetical protein